MKNIYFKILCKILEMTHSPENIYQDMVKEMTDAMAAAQAYASNVTAFNTLKTVIAQGLEIGK